MHNFSLTQAVRLHPTGQEPATGGHRHRRSLTKRSTRARRLPSVRATKRATARQSPRQPCRAASRRAQRQPRKGPVACPLPIGLPACHVPLSSSHRCCLPWLAASWRCYCSRPRPPQRRPPPAPQALRVRARAPVRARRAAIPAPRVRRSGAWRIRSTNPHRTRRQPGPPPAPRASRAQAAARVGTTRSPVPQLPNAMRNLSVGTGGFQPDPCAPGVRGNGMPGCNDGGAAAVLQGMATFMQMVRPVVPPPH